MASAHKQAKKTTKMKQQDPAQDDLDIQVEELIAPGPSKPVVQPTETVADSITVSSSFV